MATNKIIFKNGFDKNVNKNFYRYYLLRKSSFMFLFFIMGVVCLIMLLTGLVVPEESSFQYILMWSITLLGILFMPLYTIMNIRSSARRDFEKRKDIVEIYEITKEKIQRAIVGVPNKIAINWNTIAKVVEVNDAFYFFTEDGEAFTISKKGLIEGTIDSFRQLIITYLKKNKKGRVAFTSKNHEYNQKLKQLKQERKRKK